MAHLISIRIGFHIAYTAVVPNLSMNMYPFSISIDARVPLQQWFPNFFKPLPKSRQQVCLITHNISQWSLII